MAINLVSLISYVLISTFTPGPSNISSTSLALLHGYPKTLRYQAGLAFGVFTLMLLSGLFSSALLGMFPVLEPVLRYIGAAYILYLAFKMLKANYAVAQADTTSLGIGDGFILQILNPKLMVYAFTVYTAFLVPIATNAIQVTLSAFLLAGTSFCATSTWALFGTAMQTYLHNTRWKTTINIILSITLVYSALSLLHLF